MKKIYPILFLLLAACGFSYAQPAHLSVDNLTTDNGLPSNVVSAIVQDNEGYMWFATYRGVVRYDGYTMHRYNLRTTDEGWYNENIARLFKDKQGNIWAGLQPGGAFRYDRTTDSFIHYTHKANDKQSLRYNNVSEFYNGLHNDVWVLTSNYSFNSWALCRFNARTGRFTNYGPAEKGKYYVDSVYSIHPDSLGNLWATGYRCHSLYQFNEKQGAFIKYAFFPFRTIALSFDKNVIWFDAGKGLVKFDVKKKTYTLLKHVTNDPSSLQNDTVYNCLHDKENRPWIVTNAGVSRLNTTTNKFTNFPFDKNIPKGYYYDLADRSGNFWFVNWVTEKAMMVYFNTKSGRYTVYPLNKDGPQSLKQAISSLVVDDTNNLWVGNVAGASRINNVSSAFNTYTVNDTSFTGMIQTFLESGKNALYMGTDRGLYQYNLENNTSTRIKYSKDSLENANGVITAMVKNDDGTMVIGSLDLVFFDPKSGTTHTFKYNKKQVDCTSIVPAGNNGYWIGTQRHGLLFFDGKTGKFKGFKFNENRPAKPDKRILDDASVTVVYKDKSGTIWAGTNYGGINRFNPADSSFTSSFYQYPAMTAIDDIHEDKLGQFWVATDFTGLFLFDRKTGKVIRHFTQKDGLLSYGIDKIIEDNSGRIWLTNTLGLVSIDIKNFAVKSYTHDNALPTNNINWLPYKMSDGTELFSTLNGFFRVRLDDLKPDPDAPVVHIETVLHSDPASSSGKSDTVRALVQKQVELPYNQNRVTFTFVAIHYSFPLASRYSYELVNFDKNWVNSRTQRSVTYNNLSPGTYIFKVKAANGDGVWNNAGDTFTLIIDAPWWTRWWAWLLWIVLFVSAVYGFIAYRSRKLLQDKKVLEHKVHIRTEEVMQQKEEIESQRDNLEKTLGDLKSTQTQLIQSEKMASLGELTAGIAHEIQNPLNFVNNFSDVNAELLVEMQQEIEKGDLAEIKALSLDIYENEKKINQHGKRADSIVKGMLEHSRTRSGQKEPTDLNAMADEFMRLSYHGLRAKDKTFNSELVTDFDPDLPKINVIQQDMGRVLLNLFNNAFYAVNQKKNTAGADYKPTVSVTTLIRDRHAVVIVKDNGIGIPDAIKAKIMQPFFTTKPTGEGTGLGLSLTYDMVVKGHGGDIRVNSVEGEGSEFIISLPVG